MKNIPYLIEKLSQMHILYHWQVFPLSIPAKKALEARIKRTRDLLDALLAAECSPETQKGD